MQVPLGLDFLSIQTRWKSAIDQLLANPANSSVILRNVSLANGTTVVNHRLGRVPQGWQIIDIEGAALIYRSAPLNDLTITLTSNAAVTVNLEVF